MATLRTRRPTRTASGKVWRHEPRPLDPIFYPKTVALVGATENPGSVGRTLLENLLATPGDRKLYPVNMKRDTLMGQKCYPSLSALPEVPELCVIATPAPTVPDIISECVRLGVKAAVIISAGFKELGTKGEELEDRIRKAAAGRMRIVGPNCLGVMNPQNGLNATFAGALALPGHVGFISQSGALCTAVLDWSLRERVGFSSFVSLGSMLDVGWGDLIDHLGDDPETKSILIYMESIGDAHAFLSAAREVALSKPIIVLKVGRTESAMKAALSHTGTIAGSDAVLDAAFRRSGVLRVGEIRELFHMAEILAKQPKPQGPKLVILTNAGGPGVLATDALILSGGALTDLSNETMRALNAFLPEHWSRRNPVDILGDAGPDRYVKSLEILAADQGSDGMLVVLTPQAMTDPTATARALVPYAHMDKKPLLASWMGAGNVEEGRQILREAGIPVLEYPDEAARLFEYMWQYSDNLRSLYETPALTEPVISADTAARHTVADIISGAQKDGRTLLTEFEAKRILTAYGIPTTPTTVARTAGEAASAAIKTGFPVVLKLHSETLTHKTDVGGIALNLKDADAVKEAFERIRDSVTRKAGSSHFLGVTVQPFVKGDGYELIIGSSPDTQFGPVILFGMGGQNVEVFKDTSLALPPLNTTLARRLMERTRIFSAFKGIRGRDPIDRSALDELLVRFSELVVTQPRIQEIDINPLFVSPEKCFALDARIVLYPKDVPDQDLPRPAIRPYPAEYVTRRVLTDGTRLELRPIRPEDEPLMVKFHQSLSEETVRRRYFTDMRLDLRVAHDRLVRVCFNDYDRELAFVAEHTDPSGGPEIIGVARLSRRPGTSEAEYSMIVRDSAQNRGLGKLLCGYMLEVCRRENLKRVFAEIQSDNLAMQKVFGALGFTIVADKESGTLKAEFIFK